LKSHRGAKTSDIWAGTSKCQSQVQNTGAHLLSNQVKCQYQNPLSRTSLVWIFSLLDPQKHCLTHDLLPIKLKTGIGFLEQPQHFNTSIHFQRNVTFMIFSDTYSSKNIGKLFSFILPCIVHINGIGKSSFILFILIVFSTKKITHDVIIFSSVG